MKGTNMTNIRQLFEEVDAPYQTKFPFYLRPPNSTYSHLSILVTFQEVSSEIRGRDRERAPTGASSTNPGSVSPFTTLLQMQFFASFFFFLMTSCPCAHSWPCALYTTQGCSEESGVRRERLQPSARLGTGPLPENFKFISYGCVRSRAVTCCTVATPLLQALLYLLLYGLLLLN